MFWSARQIDAAFQRKCCKCHLAVGTSLGGQCDLCSDHWARVRRWSSRWASRDWPKTYCVGKNVEPASCFSPEDLDLDPGELCQSAIGEKAGCIYRADEFTNGRTQGDDFKNPTAEIPGTASSLE